MYVLSEKIAINYIEGRYKRNVCDMKYVRTINNWILLGICLLCGKKATLLPSAVF